MSDDTLTLKAHIDGVDHIAQHMEAKWGKGRLPLLVSAETRAKFYKQGQRMREALEACYGAQIMTRDMLADVASRTAGMERAWAALDKQATEAGEKPIDTEVWETVLSDGSLVAIVQTNADAGKVLADGRLKNVWTLEEVARAIEAFPDVIRSIKEAFEGATVEAVKEKRFQGLRSDPIPF